MNVLCQLHSTTKEEKTLSDKLGLSGNSSKVLCLIIVTHYTSQVRTLLGRAADAPGLVESKAKPAPMPVSALRNKRGSKQ